MLWSLVQRRRLRGPGQAAPHVMSTQDPTGTHSRRTGLLVQLACLGVLCVCVHGDIPTHDMTSGRMPSDVGCPPAICSPWRQGQRIDAAGQLPARAASSVASAGAGAQGNGREQQRIVDAFMRSDVIRVVLVQTQRHHWTGPCYFASPSRGGGFPESRL
jgi:hypothetical protein